MNMTNLAKKGGTVKKGLFTVRHIEDKWYFEVPDSIIGRYLLAVTRLAAVPLQDWASLAVKKSTRIRFTLKRETTLLYF